MHKFIKLQKKEAASFGSIPEVYMYVYYSIQQIVTEQLAEPTRW